MRLITDLVVHCSATPEGMDIGAKQIRQWHMNPPNSWNDIGYHYVIRLNGVIEKGREDAVAGAHVAGHNANSLGICMVGGLDHDGRNPKATFTAEQYKALHALLHDLQHKYPSATNVKGHRDYPGVHKACPSFDVQKWWGPGGHDRNGLPL
jgi:N-acetylmuramoyl-L-alanine amidase